MARPVGAWWCGPLAAFVVAVGLSFLSGGLVHHVLARQAGGTTPCTGSATGTSITVAAGTGINKKTPGWNFSITDQPVDSTNNVKSAELLILDYLTMSAKNVEALDKDGKKHALGVVKFMTFYAPGFTKTFPPGSRTVNPTMSISRADLEVSLKEDVIATLKAVKVMKVSGEFFAQQTMTSQIITFTCTDGTDLPTTPRPVTLMAVNAKGDGGPIKN